jgi:uncharacterized protein (TIGR03086 family)
MDIRELNRLGKNATGQVIDGIPDDRLDAPTPCTEWTVQQVIEHMTANARHYVTTLAGLDPLPVNASPASAFHTTAAAMADVFTDDKLLETPIVTPGGVPRTGAQIMAIDFLDVFVHGWDIARAVGEDITLDDRLSRTGIEIAEQFPDTPDVRGPGGAFALPVTAAEDAPAGTRLIALLGRSSAWPAA